MSRIGKKIINIPKDVEVKIDGRRVVVKGPKGELSEITPSELKVELRDSTGEESGGQKELIITPQGESKKIYSLWGLFRSLVSNMIKGTTEGFEKKLEVEGIGFRAALSGNKLVLNLGLSHPVEIEAPEGIEFNVEKNVITVSGRNKQLVGQIAAKIRDQKRPEPYKGKGIRYSGEIVRRKAGKKAAAAE